MKSKKIDTRDKLQGSWNSEYFVFQEGMVANVVRSPTPYMAVEEADKMCPRYYPNVLVQIRVDEGSSLETVAERHRHIWSWKMFKSGTRACGKIIHIEANLANGFVLRFPVKDIDTAKMTIEAMCVLFDMNGDSNFCHEGKLYKLTIVDGHDVKSDGAISRTPEWYWHDPVEYPACRRDPRKYEGD